MSALSTADGDVCVPRWYSVFRNIARADAAAAAAAPSGQSAVGTEALQVTGSVDTYPFWCEEFNAAGLRRGGGE